MGFCLINNVAVAATALADRGERVIIVDWDVHHGNGTQALFWNDDRVCYVSTHQARFYPGTGAFDETGGPGAPGLTVNVPLPAGSVARSVAPEPSTWTSTSLEAATVDAGKPLSFVSWTKLASLSR
jgi:acetoin utilization deacetylase AcuC-like enzyme